jgi:hypothetical protein
VRSAPADHGEGIALLDIERLTRLVHWTDVQQGHGNVLATGGDCEVLARVGEAKLKGEIRVGIPVIVDVDRIDRARIQLIEIRPPPGS